MTADRPTARDLLADEVVQFRKWEAETGRFPYRLPESQLQALAAHEYAVIDISEGAMERAVLAMANLDELAATDPAAIRGLTQMLLTAVAVLTQGDEQQ